MMPMAYTIEIGSLNKRGISSSERGDYSEIFRLDIVHTLFACYKKSCPYHKTKIF